MGERERKNVKSDYLEGNSIYLPLGSALNEHTLGAFPGVIKLGGRRSHAVGVKGTQAFGAGHHLVALATLPAEGIPAILQGEGMLLKYMITKLFRDRYTQDITRTRGSIR